MEARERLLKAFGNRRTGSVALLAFASGMPLGLVWIAIPDWMRSSGIDIRIVGLTTLAHAPWTFKILWSPLLDRFSFPWLGRRRGWMALFQVLLFAGTLALAGGASAEAPMVIIALAMVIAFASASFDIAYDAFTVDVLNKDEQGVAVGAKISFYRVAMQLAGAISITLSASLSWNVVIGLQSIIYLGTLAVTVWFATEPKTSAKETLTLEDAVWKPFIGFLSRHRALEILAFVIFYKFADSLSQSLLRPFLVDMGFNEYDRGLALLTIGLACTLAGTFLGGSLTTAIGLGHSLWIFGLLQIFSNFGYLFIIWSESSRLTMYGAMGFETFTTGLGMGAFGTFLVRLTEKKFSATQYALFSSLFALPRLLAGPITGMTVHSFGWEFFFWMTMVAGIPGLLLLQRFSPLGKREPTIVHETDRQLSLDRPAWIRRGWIGGIVGLIGGSSLYVLLRALGDWGDEGYRFDFVGEFRQLLSPEGYKDGFTLLSLVIFGLCCGLFVAAYYAARSGAYSSDE